LDTLKVGLYSLITQIYFLRALSSFSALFLLQTTHNF